MTDREAYNIILQESACLQQRETCSKQCSSCDLKMNTKYVQQGLNYVLNVLKARSPELYLLSDLWTMREVINHGDKNQKT